MIAGRTCRAAHQGEGWRERGEGEMDPRFKPPGEDLCGQIHLSLSLPVCLSLPLSLMLSFCLALTDLFRGGDQNESPALSSPHPSLSPLLHWLTASPPSFSLTLSLSRSPSLYFWAFRGNKRNRGWGRRWGGGEKMNIFFLSLWPALKDSLALTHKFVTFFPSPLMKLSFLSFSKLQ